jgi:SAM-dependent methyltransferase
MIRVENVLRACARRLPAPIRDPLRAAVHRLAGDRWRLGASARQRPPGTIKWGHLRRLEPLSRNWGHDRGTPIDRIYIEEFLAKHAADVRGSCLEVRSPTYTQRFGADRVTRSDVLDVNPANPAATVVADLSDPDSLPPGRFDCVIFTQTLQIIPDMRAAVANVWRALAPGGVILLTVPTMGFHESGTAFDNHRWRVTRLGLQWLLGQLPAARVETATYGNLLSCVAFLYGMAAEELRPDELAPHDPDFPMIVAASVRKEVQ